MSRNSIYRFNSFVVDHAAWRLYSNKREIHLEPTVLKLLIYLITHRDRLVTRQELMDTVWGDTVISDSALTKAVGRLRKALGDESSKPLYVETVHSKGYRFIAEVDEVKTGSSEEASAGFDRPPSMRRGLALAVAIGALMILAYLFWPNGMVRDRPQAIEIRSLAVLPLENLTGDPDQDYLVDGLQEILITELSQIEGLEVKSRQSMKRFRGDDTPLQEIAREVGVESLLEGSVHRVGDRIEITLQLIRGRTDDHLWAEHYERETKRVLDLSVDVANAIGAALGLRPTVSPMGAIDPSALEAYLRGLHHMDQFTGSGLRQAIDEFRTATEIEPAFGLGWGALSAAYAMYARRGHAPQLEYIKRSQTAALKAIESGNSAWMGYAGLGWTRLWTRDLRGACEAFREALRINPSAPYAIHGDAECMMFTGRIDDHVDRIRELAMIEAQALIHNRPLSFHLFYARRYDEALAVTLNMQKRFPGFTMHVILSFIYWTQGEFEKALEEERRLYEMRNDRAMLTALESGLDAGGPHAAMRAIAETMVARSQDSYVDPFRIGETFARAGALDEALYWFNRAVDHGSSGVIYIEYRPDFDALKGHPGYLELIRRAGFENEIDP